MTELCPLGSGSSGNSTLVRSGGTLSRTTLLVDAGLSCKAICTALEQAGSHYEELDAILLTHEHSDHIKALPVLLKKLSCPVYATEAVLDYISKNLKIPAHIPLVPLSENSFTIGDFQVKAFPTPHDSVGSVGYQFRTGEDQFLAVATDIGHMTPEIMEHLLPCKAVLLESNYDEGMLMCSSYPYTLKRRIVSSKGHLSNIDCAAAALTLAENRLEHLILGHLSENNNLPELAYSTTRNVLDNAGFHHIDLQVAQRSQVSKAVHF